jgi:hypothetical protein
MVFVLIIANLLFGVWLFWTLMLVYDLHRHGASMGGEWRWGRHWYIVEKKNETHV